MYGASLIHVQPIRWGASQPSIKQKEKNVINMAKDTVLTVEIEDLKNGSMQLDVHESKNRMFSGTYSDMNELMNDVGSILKGGSIATHDNQKDTIPVISRPFFTAEVNAGGIVCRLKGGFGKAYGEFVDCFLSAGVNNAI